MRDPEQLPSENAGTFLIPAYALIDLQRELLPAWLAEQGMLQSTWDANTPYPDTDLNRRYHQVVAAIGELPTTQPDEATAAYIGLATGIDKGDRQLAASLIPKLAQVDLNGALSIWEYLLADQDGDVREVAWESLRDSLREDDLPPLRGSQISKLLEAYELTTSAVRGADGDPDHYRS